jgi:hypothetical protein
VDQGLWIELLCGLPAEFAAQTLPGGSLLGSLFLAGLQIKGMFLNLFDDIFLLDFALESLQGTFQGFTILYYDFCQLRNHLLRMNEPGSYHF